MEISSGTNCTGSSATSDLLVRTVKLGFVDPNGWTRIVAGCATDVVDRQWDQVMRSNAPAIVYEWTDQPLRRFRVVKFDGYQDHLKTVIWLLSLAGATGAYITSM